MFLLRTIYCLLLVTPAFATDYFLTVTEIDQLRDRATFKMEPEGQIPNGTLIRVHGKAGTCLVTITERVNNQLVAATRDCFEGILNPGTRLSYNDEGIGPREGQMVVAGENTTENDMDMDEFYQTYIKDRMSIYLGHNFASNLEGKVNADGSYKNLAGSSAFSLGLLGTVYRPTTEFGIQVGLGHEFTRTFDEATYIIDNAEQTIGVIGNEPEISLWNLLVQGELSLTDEAKAFAGIHYSLPNVDRVNFDLSGDIGFQVGGNFEVYEQLLVEALIKITNMNLKNGLGETTDVSLSGLEIRGRYTF